MGLFCKILTAFLVVLSLFETQARISDNYQLDLSDPSTFSYGEECSEINPAQWKVSNDSCFLQTCPINITTAGNFVISIKINLSGNMESNDNVYIQYSFNGEGFTNDTIFNGDISAAVFIYTDTINLTPGQIFEIKIIAETDTNNEFWQIKDGNISFGQAEPVPVCLLYFNAEFTDEQSVYLEWATASEYDADYYVIERSADGCNFDPIVRIECNNDNNNNEIILKRNNFYSYTDISPLPGCSYYRLKQVDKNGEYTYFSMVSVENNNFRFLVYPNPVHNEPINILFNGVLDGELSVMIFNLQGEQVYYINKVYNQSGMQINYIFGPGLYNITVIYNNIERSGKIIVL